MGNMKMYVWQIRPKFLAVAQATSIEEARGMFNFELGTGGDGSCPIRDQAREFIKRANPGIWYGNNAEFVLTDSAELEEAEAEIVGLRGEIVRLKEALEEVARDPHAGTYVAQVVDEALNPVGTKAAR